jgi:FKBP-type peptidyl-prolyl cis-trans isomerase FkpA
MAEVTRVPLRPVSRQSLLMLILGIVIGLLIAGAIAWATMPKGVSVDELTAGTGGSPKAEDVVFVNYVGKLDDGTEFDRSQAPPFPIQGILPEGMPLLLSQMLPGFREAAMKMQKGGKYEVVIPADKAYGATPPPGSPIPPNADLHFEIEMIDFMPVAEADRRVQTMQQMMVQQQQQQGAQAGQGAAGAPPPAPQPATPPQQ